MTAQPAHDTWAAPTWQVQWVIDDQDPMHNGFAYTIGLHDRGRPEVHITNRPGLGDDRAPDWKLSGNDMCVILNDVGRRLVAGSVRVGDEWQERYDGGLVTARFRLDPPGDPEQLETYGIAPTAQILPLRWSLHRASPGPRTSVRGEERRYLVRRLAAITSEIRLPSRMVPPRWSGPYQPTFAKTQRYGPRTQLVRARAASVWSADAATLTNLLVLAGQIEHGGASARWPTTIALSEGRQIGLDDAVRQIDDDVCEVAHRHRPGRTAETWRSVVAELLDAPPPAKVIGETNPADNVLHLFIDVVTSALVVEALGWDASTDTRRAGLGPWLCAQLPEGSPPGPEWEAAPSVVQRLHEIVADLTVGDRHTVGIGHRRTYLRESAYSYVVDKLLGWAATSAAGCPPVQDLSSGWASTITSALSYRMRLTTDEVEILAAPMAGLLPRLAHALNEPI